MEPQGKTCPNPECKRSALPEEAVYCPDCGTALSQSYKSEKIGTILFELENEGKTQTQQVNSPKSVFPNTNEQKRKVTNENNTVGAQSSSGSTVLYVLEGIGNFFISVGGFIFTWGIPVVLLIFLFYKGCS